MKILVASTGSDAAFTQKVAQTPFVCKYISTFDT